jgi:hypothetical protein
MALNLGLENIAASPIEAKPQPMKRTAIGSVKLPGIKLPMTMEARIQ